MDVPASSHSSLLTYDEALAFLDSLDVSAMKLGLARVERLLETLGKPQDSLPMVHIAGTNGKGSVTAMLSSILKFSGYSVGTFTSPHLIHVRERIAINGNPILPDDFQYEVSALKEHLETLNWPRDDWPTYFEFLNVVAYHYFRRKGVNITVFETGLGGRLDSTNVVKHPNLTVITTIGMDHMQHLGDTLEKIASEKAGIIKPGVPVVLGGHLPEAARAVILKQAAHQEAPTVEAKPDVLTILPSSSPDTGLLIEDTQQQKTYQLSLAGPYQKDNLATVLACIQQLRQQNYEIDEEAIRDGLLHTYWPVRFQYFPKEHLILDGSHNEDGFNTLAECLSLYYPNTPKLWLVSLRANRNPQHLWGLIRRVGQPVALIITEGNPGHLYHPAQALAEAAQAIFNDTVPICIADSPTDALALLHRQQQTHLNISPIGIVTGSLYTAGEILHCLNRV